MWDNPLYDFEERLVGNVVNGSPNAQRVRPDQDSMNVFLEQNSQSSSLFSPLLGNTIHEDKEQIDKPIPDKMFKGTCLTTLESSDEELEKRTYKGGEGQSALSYIHLK